MEEFFNLMDTQQDVPTVKQEDISVQAQVDIPHLILTYNIYFMEPDKFPKVFGKPLQQRVWVVVGKVKALPSKTTLKRMKKLLEHAMDYSKHFDPYWRIKTSSMKIIGCNDTVHIVMDTIMSRTMRREALAVLAHLDFVPETVVLMTNGWTSMYKVPEVQPEPLNIVTNILLSTLQERSKYMLEFSSFPVFDLTRPDVLLTVNAKGKPEPKRGKKQQQ